MKPGKTAAPPPAKAKITAPLPSLFPWDFKMRCYIILIVGFIFYANTLANKYALDDSIAIERNTFVQKGIPGIGKILTSDSYASFYKAMGAKANAQYSGGRYRPLSIVTFAMEQSLFGNPSILPFTRHLVNVLFFLTCLLAIFYFLNDYLLKKLPGGPDIAFLSVFLFAIHPIHTEVVANIKSLDEIMSLTFIMTTFIFSLRYVTGQKRKDLIYGLIFYFLALMAKEYAVTLIILLPLLFYILADKTPGEAIKKSLPYYAVFILYLLIRHHAVGFSHATAHATDPQVDPFMFASSTQKYATKLYALGRYMCMLFFPWPLSCDYSFAQIPYYNFSDISVILSILLYGAITVWAFIELRKRSVIAFLLFFFLGCIALISNFVVDLGAVLGERLLFHSSIAFLVILSYYALNSLKKVPLKKKKTWVMGCLAGLTLVCGAITLPRNAQWKEDDTLFLHDVKVCPNSAMLNNNAGWCYVGLAESPANKPAQARALLDSAKKYLYKTLAINNRYTAAYINLATAYFNYGTFDSSKHYIDIVTRKFFAHEPSLLYTQYPALNKISNYVTAFYLNTAIRLGGQHKPHQAINDLKKAINWQPDNADLWYNLGGAYYTIQNYDSARYAWNITLKLKPGYANALRGLQALPRSVTGNHR